MKIEDILVTIKFANENQQQKGMLGFASVRFRIEWNNTVKYQHIKGFTIRRSEKGYKDKFGSYLFVTPPATQTKTGRFMTIIFFENENFKQDKDWWNEIVNRILEEYRKEINNKESNRTL